jgi:glycosyltransferase involved in cell wall biosynthesis
MESNPIVSVIVPNYNHARYLPRRIESILGQSYDSIEVLIMDDCSSDNSQAVIQRYAANDTRIEILFNTANSGSTFKQWEKGLAWAKGKYIWIAESDDFAEPTFLTELVPMLEDNDSVVLAYANSRVVDEHDQANGTTADWKNERYHTQRWSENYTVDGKQEIEHYLSLGCTINNASAVLFRRSSMEEVGGVDTSFRYAGDWLMYLKLSLHGLLSYKGACLSNYREHSVNTSKNSLHDGSQRFERQRCFAYLYYSKKLSSASLERVLSTASEEFLFLAYDLLRRSWQPKLFASYVRRLASNNTRFYMHVQARVVNAIARRQY